MINTLIMNIVGPFIIWKTQRFPVNVVFENIESKVFMEGMSQEYKGLASSLEDLGFKCIGSSVLSDTDSDTFFRLYWSKELKTAATCVSGINVFGETNFIDFSQKYSDGSTLNVSNNPVTEVYPKLDIKTSYKFPSVSNTIELLDIFNRFKKGHKSSGLPVDFNIERGFEEVELFMRLESDELARKGIFKSDVDAEGKRALTFYGAVYLTYRAISPGKNIFGYFAEKQSKRALSRVSIYKGPSEN